jgi:hypothetical protein
MVLRPNALVNVPSKSIEPEQDPQRLNRHRNAGGATCKTKRDREKDMSVITTSFPARRTLGAGIAGVVIGGLLGLLIGYVLASAINVPGATEADAAAPVADRTTQLSYEHVMRENAGIQATTDGAAAGGVNVRLLNEHTLREYRSDAARPAVDFTEKLRQHHQREYGTP